MFDKMLKQYCCKHDVWTIIKLNQYLNLIVAVLLETHRAQHCKYIALQFANIC
jgi:hypothetical protein